MMYKDRSGDEWDTMAGRLYLVRKNGVPVTPTMGCRPEMVNKLYGPLVGMDGKTMQFKSNDNPLAHDGSFKLGTYPISSQYRVDVTADLETETGYRVTLQRREVYTNDRTGAKHVVWEDVASLDTELSPDYTARDVVLTQEWIT